MISDVGDTLYSDGTHTLFVNDGCLSCYSSGLFQKQQVFTRTHCSNYAACHIMIVYIICYIYNTLLFIHGQRPSSSFHRVVFLLRPWWVDAISTVQNRDDDDDDDDDDDWWWCLPSGLMNQGTKCLTSLDSTNARATVWWLDLIWYCHACRSAYTSRCWNCNSWNSIKALIVPRDSLKWAIW